MCVAQQKPVGFLVHVSHLVFYAVEQSQLVKVAQCEHSRLVYRPVAASCVFGVYQGRRQLGRSNGFQFSIGSLLHPSVAIAIVYGSLHPTGYQTLVVHTRLYLDEISCRSAFAVAKVLYVNAVVVQNVEEQFSLVHNLRLSLIAQFAQFRSVLLEIYGGQCCVCGLSIKELLRASHILPWAESKPNRLNPENGICLSATYDAAFDKYLISFDDDYRMVVSPYIREFYTNDAAKEYFERYEGKQLALPYKFSPNKEFLSKHREKLIGI